MDSESQQGWVLYDGECSMCLGFVQRVKPTLAKRGFRFAPLQEAWVRQRLGLVGDTFPEEMKVFTPDGRTLGGTDAILYLGSRVWWMKPSVWIARLPGIHWLVDRNYKRIAATRRCRLPHTGKPRCTAREEILRWTRGSAIFGFVTLLALSLFSWSRDQFSTILTFLVAGPLLIVPLGLRAFVKHDGAEGKNPGEALLRWAALFQPLAACAVVAALLFQPGVPAASIAACWIAPAGLFATAGIWRLFRLRIAPNENLAITGALLFAPVGAIWIVLSRLGANPFGFFEPIPTLTAVHFHYTSFAAPVLLGLLFTKSDPYGGLRPILRGAILGLLGGIVMIAAGFTASRGLRFAGVLLLSLSLLAAGSAQIALAGLFQRPAARRLLTVSGGCLLAGMLLALVYEIGDYMGNPWIAIDQMAISHGVLNGIGFSLLGLFAWNLEAPSSKTAAP